MPLAPVQISPEPVTERLRHALSAASRVRVDVPLGPLTTLGVGGAADWLIEVGGEADLGNALRCCAALNLPWRVIGRGSNLLVRDGGYRGVILLLTGDWSVGVEAEGCRLACGAGARLKTVAARARGAGIAGLEFLEGIPGSLGGALRMNAGAHGAWMHDVVESVRYADPAGRVGEVRREDLPVAYRACDFFRDRVAIAAVLRGGPGDPEAIRGRMEAFARQRRATQPREASAGCVFKNPAPAPAGLLIDQLGLKGTRIGGARVSERHGNFIVNDRGATAGDVLALIALLRERVEATGIRLETEVEILGEDPAPT